MSRTITLKLTQKEADALCHAAGNTLASDDNELLELFNQDRAAMWSAVRAFNKLKSAITAGGSR